MAGELPAANWLGHKDLQALLASPEIPSPWFPAYRHVRGAGEDALWYSALVPVRGIKKRLKNASWDVTLGSGGPSVWTYYQDKGKSNRSVYFPFGNDEGIEPLVIWREFRGIRGDFPEVSQEFRLYHNLYSEPAKKRLLSFNKDGDESEAVRYSDDLVEFRSDLLQRFCAIKQIALAIYVDSNRQTIKALEELGLEEKRELKSGPTFVFNFAVVPWKDMFDKEFKSLGRLLGKKYVLPGRVPQEGSSKDREAYQEFIIGAESDGRPIRHTCNPEMLADYFGKNPHAPNYVTPVFFRNEVLSKYYADAGKYSVEDGYLRCGGLWGLRMDNDNPDYVVVWLGDLGRDLSEGERNYWLSFNVAPAGRKVSRTGFRRAFLAEPTDPAKADLAFKSELARFQKRFGKVVGWDFFRPLHRDDAHFLASLRLLAKDNQAEFDSQLLALTKILADSINEEQISKGLATLTKDDKGITKLQKFFAERGLAGFEPHIKFLRVLQDLRSKSAAHRKGTNYEKLVKELHLADEGQQKVFAQLIGSAIALVQYLDRNLLPAVER